MQSIYLLFLSTLCLFSLLACAPSLASTLPPTTELAAMDPTPTSKPAALLPPPIPTQPPPAIPTEMNPILERDADNLAVYRQAMLPQFTEDVDMVARAGASRYYIEITLDPDSLHNKAGLILNGLERVQYTNTEEVSLSEIYFRLYPNLPAYNGVMEVASVVVDGHIVEPQLEANNTALHIPLSQPLAPGDQVDLSLMFTVQVPVEAGAGYNIFVYDGGTATLAGFYPAVAVYDDDGWDTQLPPPYGDAPYMDVALYQVQLTVPDNMVVAASGSEAGRVLPYDGTQTLSLVSGPIREFFIAMRPNYKTVTETVGEVTVNSHYPANWEAGGQQALRNAADALRVYSAAFGPYPYAEFDIVATPTTAGGIEYAGIVAINQQLYEFPGMFFQQAIAHEVAHQWWYNVVGNDQVDEPWLDEALTNYSTVFYWEETEGNDVAAQVVKAYFENPYQNTRESGQDRAVLGPVSDFSERDYGIIVYGKGPLFFKSLREEVGNDTYLKIMQTYFDRYKYQVAQGNNLLGVIEEISGQDIGPLFEQWIAATQPAN
jgi:hypothetical protein